MYKNSKKKNLIQALQKSMGVITIACRAVGIDRSTYYDWLSKDANFAKQVEDIQEEQIDFVESKLLSSINEGDTTAIIYYLKTKGRNRGWNERIELTGKEGKDLYEGMSNEELEKRVSNLIKMIDK